MASTGRFEAAKLAAAQRATTNLAELVKSSGRDENAVRSAGTRTFLKKDGVWTDTRSADGLRVVKVKAYSAAYFAIVRRMPELGALFSVAEHVRLHGRHVAIEIADDGASELEPVALDALAADW